MNNPEQLKRKERTIRFLMWFQVACGVAVIAYCFKAHADSSSYSPENVPQVSRGMYDGLFELYKIVAFSAVPTLAAGHIIFGLGVLNYLKKR